MPGRRAVSGVSKYNAESPKQDSKRFSCQVGGNTLPICMGMLFIYGENIKITVLITEPDNRDSISALQSLAERWCR